MLECTNAYLNFLMLLNSREVGQNIALIKNKNFQEQPFRKLIRVF
jgi:hypothetical protein